MKKILLAAAIFCLMAMNALQAQELGKGLEFDDAGYQSQERLGGSGMSFSEDPRPQASVKAYCPAIGNQGRIGSCVGWASAYAGLTISFAKKAGMTDKSQITAIGRSALYVYHQIKTSSGCDQGTRIDDALRFLQEKGDCGLIEYNPSECDGTPDGSLSSRAQNYKIKDFGTLFAIGAPAEQKQLQTMRSISEGKPVVIGMLVPQSFDAHRGDLYSPAPDESFMGGHAMCVVGYDKMRRTFEIMNSWGTAWGNQGFFSLGFDDFARLVKYGYQINVDPPPPPPTPVNPNPPVPSRAVTLSGEFVFKKYNGYDEKTGAYLFAETPVTFNGSTYTIGSGSMDKDTYFRLLAKKMKKDSYFYIFSVKPDNTVEILFPRDKAFSTAAPLDEDGVSIKDLPRIVSNTAELTIPSDATGGLVADQAGNDYLCILYSDKLLPNIQEIVKQVGSASGDFSARLQAVLGSKLIPSRDIQYSNGVMKLSTTSSSGGYIAPLVFKAVVR